MMVLRAMLFCILLSASDSALACRSDNVVFKDSFEHLDPTWGSSIADQQELQNGTMILRPKPESAMRLLNQAGLFQNGEICGEVSISKAGTLEGALIGLIFWAVDYDNYYVLEITGDGRFSLLRLQAGRSLHPIGFQHTTAIKPGTGTWNELSVRIRDNHLVVSINGIQVGTLDKTYPPEGGGMIGLYIESDGSQNPPVVGAFRNLTFAE